MSGKEKFLGQFLISLLANLRAASDYGNWEDGKGTEPIAWNLISGLVYN